MSYQNICSGKFERDCSERWSLIKKELPESGVILDIGCAEGYFLERIAEETNLLAVGIEKQRGRVLSHRKWIRDYHKGKVIDCYGSLSFDLVKRISETPEWIDGVLLLSVLHWINNDEYFKMLCSFSGKVFVEIPNLDDHNATGQKFMNRVREIGSEEKYFRQVTGRDVRLLGRVKAHTDEYRNLWVIEGAVKKLSKKPSVIYKGTNFREFKQVFDGHKIKFSHRRVKEGYQWIHGINLATLSEMNVVYPEQSWWEQKIQKSIDEIDQEIKGDMRIQNMIVSRDKFSWIDLDHQAMATTIFKEIEGMVSEDF